MKRNYLTWFFFVAAVSFGVSGCDRWEFAVIEYILSSCPQDTEGLPKEARDDNWELKPAKPWAECRSFSTYELVARSEKKPNLVGLGVRLKRGKNCSLLVASAFDRIAEPQFQDRLETGSKVAASILANKLGLSIGEKPMKIEFTGKKNSFEQWCSSSESG